jgi:hypothetical protein
MDITKFSSVWDGATYLDRYFNKPKILLDLNALNGIKEHSQKYNLSLYDDITNCFAQQIEMLFMDFRPGLAQDYQLKNISKFIDNLRNCFNKMINSLAISLTAIEMRSYAKGKADCTPVVTNRYYAPAGMSLRDAIPTNINELSYLSNEEMEQIVFGLADDVCGKINVG